MKGVGEEEKKKGDKANSWRGKLAEGRDAFCRKWCEKKQKTMAAVERIGAGRRPIGGEITAEEAKCD